MTKYMGSDLASRLAGVQPLQSLSGAHQTGLIADAVQAMGVSATAPAQNADWNSVLNAPAPATAPTMGMGG